jgi:hypothetical protein
MLLREVAAKFGVSRNTLTRCLRGDGIEIRRRPMSDEEVDQAVMLYQEGKSLVAIGQALSFSGGTIGSVLRKREVQMRDTHGRYPGGLAACAEG